MDRMNGDAWSEESAPSSRRAALFVGFLVAYYAVYYYFFSLRILEYARDILRHFAFVRRFI
jgi:hypothetical protein